MIDWHCHILPGIDDGSRDTKESLDMLRMQREQGADTVIATPHFLANDSSVDSFLERREWAFDTLRPHLPEDAPRILLGAEVKYYPGIGRLPDLMKLCICGTGLLLLEMPFAKWSEYEVRELEDLAARGGIRLILAHIERYLPFEGRDVWRRIAESGILTQVNASFFTSVTTRHKALSMLKDGQIHFIGSDCHNVSSRPPKLDGAYGYISRKFGADYVDQMVGYGHAVLEQ